MNLFKKLAVDLGSSTTSIWEVGKGLVLQEPTVLALEVNSGRTLAVGTQALAMLGKQPEYIEVISPVVHGVIVDYEATREFLHLLLRKVMGPGWVLGPEVLLTVPIGITQVEQKALIDAARTAGARKVMLVDAVLASAIGAKIAVADNIGSMVFCCGSGVSEGAVIALGGLVSFRSARVGASDIENRLIDYFAKQHSLYIGQNTAQSLVKDSLWAVKPKHSENVSVTGRDAVYALPKSVTVTTESLHEATKEVLAAILGVAVAIIEHTPPELVSDIMDRGVILLGGMAQMKGLASFLSSGLNLAVHVGFEPELSTVRGAGMILENLESYEKALR